MRLPVSMLAFVLAYGVSLVAQSTAPPITVAVRDSTGAVVPGAQVIVRCDDGITVTLITGDRGTVAWTPAPRTADCGLTASAPGLSSTTRQVSAGTAGSVIDLILTPAPVSETLAVEARAAGSALSVARLNVPLIEVPQAIQVVSRATIEAQQVLRTADAARNVSAVTRAIGFDDSGDKYTVRGFLVDYSLKNGFKNNSLLSLTDIANVDSIEVLKGPASISYGRVEPGGIVNVVTKRPQPEWRSAAQVIVDRFGLTRPSIDINGPLTADRSLLFRFNGSYEHKRSHRDGVRGRTSFVSPALTWQITPRIVWSFEAEHLLAEGVPDQGLPLRDESLRLPVSLNVGRPEHDEFRNRNVRVTSWMTGQLADGWLLTAGVATLDIEAHLNQGGTVTDANAWSVFPRVDLTGRLKTGRITHAITLGGEGGSETFDVHRIAEAIAPQSAVRARGVDSFGVFAQDQIAIGRWRVLAGVRFDALALADDETNRPPASGPTPGGMVGPGQGGGPPGSNPDLGGDVEIGGPGSPTVTATPTAVTPRLGVVYYLTPTMSVYASHARSFNPPVLNLGTTSFDPTYGRQWEAGAKFELLNSRLTGGAAVFTLWKQGQTIGGGLGTTEIDAPPTTQEAKGFELDLAIRPRPDLTTTSSFAYIAGHRMMGTVIEQPDGRTFMSRENLRPERLINTPSMSGNVWSLWAPVNGALQRWTFGGGVQYVGERRINIAGQFMAPSYIRLDAMTALRLDDRWRLQLNLKNIGNSRYYETDGHFGLLLPAAPRSLELALRASF